uniref:Uncharacterized protein n=1 Tax=Anguilla anguilla TaxID=7936 RepID=A0A0E9U1I0_ANGAN
MFIFWRQFVMLKKRVLIGNLAFDLTNRWDVCLKISFVG